MSIKQQLQEEYDRLCKTFKQSHLYGSTVAVEALKEPPRCLLISPNCPSDMPQLCSFDGNDYWLQLFDAKIDIAIYELET